MPKPLTQTTGRRKAAVARVRLRPGEGAITVNKRALDDYFPSATHRQIISEPLRLTTTTESYDVDCTIHGGGIAGQLLGQVRGYRLGQAGPQQELPRGAGQRRRDGESLTPPGGIAGRGSVRAGGPRPGAGPAACARRPGTR